MAGRSARVRRRPALADHGNPDPARVVHLLLDRLRDFVRDHRRLVVVDLTRIDDHPDLAPGPHREDPLDATVARRDLLEVAKPPDVLLEGVAARAGPRAGDGVRRLDDHRFDRLRLDLAVMRFHRMRDRLRLAMAARDPTADERVRALDLVRDRLADVMKERRPPRRLRRGAELLGDQRREVRALHQVIEHVLAIARAEAKLAEEPQELRIEARDARLERCAFALLRDPGLDLLASVLVGLLDQRRVDAAVRDQPLHRDPGDLAADAVEAREHDGRWSLVDDHVDPGELLERPDVAPVAADDPALHLVVWKLDEARRRIGRVLGGEPLHCDREDVPRPPLGLHFRLRLDLLQPQSRLLLGLLLDLGDQELLRLRRAQSGEAFELTALEPLRLLELLGLLRQVPLAVLEHLEAPIDVRVLDGQRLELAQGPLLHARDLLAAGTQLAVHARRGRLRTRVRRLLRRGAIAPPR